MQRPEKKNKIIKNGGLSTGEKYSYYIWALPAVPFVLLCDKICEYLDKRRLWDEEKATKVLNYVLPYVLEWVEEDNAYYYCMDWPYTTLWRKAPFTMRKWVGKFDVELHHFVKDGYQPEGYKKTVENDGYEIWIKFEKENK